MNFVYDLFKRAIYDLTDFFDSDINHVMSKKSRDIFLHKEDRRKYVKACWRLHRGESKQEIIVLHTGEEIKITIA